MTIVRMRLDNAVLDPAREGRLVDPEESSEFRFGEQPASSQAIVAQTQAVGVHDVLDPLRSESRAALARPRRATRTKPVRVEDLGNPIDYSDYTRSFL